MLLLCLFPACASAPANVESPPAAASTESAPANKSAPSDGLVGPDLYEGPPIDPRASNTVPPKVAADSLIGTWDVTTSADNQHQVWTFTADGQMTLTDEEEIALSGGYVLQDSTLTFTETGKDGATRELTVSILTRTKDDIHLQLPGQKRVIHLHRRP